MLYMLLYTLNTGFCCWETSLIRTLYETIIFLFTEIEKDKQLHLVWPHVVS